MKVDLLPGQPCETIVNPILQVHDRKALKEIYMKSRLAGWFLGLSILFAALGVSTPAAHAQVVVAVGQPHHHYYHHRRYHHHYYHHYR
jgi:hypothetical protein